PDDGALGRGGRAGGADDPAGPGRAVVDLRPAVGNLVHPSDAVWDFPRGDDLPGLRRTVAVASRGRFAAPTLPRLYRAGHQGGDDPGRLRAWRDDRGRYHAHTGPLPRQHWGGAG